MSSSKAKFLLESEPFKSQLQKSSKFKDVLIDLNKLLNGDNPFNSKIEMKENHKIILIMATFINNGYKELNITVDRKLAHELIDELIADNCLLTMIMRVNLLLGNMLDADDYFVFYPDLKDEEKKKKEIVSICNKIKELGYSDTANRLHEQYINVFPKFKNKYDISNLSRFSLTRTMSFDYLNRRIKTEKDQKPINKLAYINLRHSR